VKAFITQCGLNSVIESVYSGTPILAIPLIADQFHNAAVVERRGLGIRLRKNQLNAETIADALRQLLDKGKSEQKYV
jgi:UDP:flavonoid glycosyltransferase YjiC (YdhE family)